jgi:hypothetical protein
MSNIVPSLATGQSIYEAGISGFSGFRPKDDAADPRDIAGAYSHRAVVLSATETNEWIGLWEFMIQQALAGGGSLGVKNSTGTSLPAGPVSVVGYDATDSLFTISYANNLSGGLAGFVLLSALANGGQGVAYVGGLFRSTVDTTLATLGDPVYVAASGMTLSEPSGISGFSGYSHVSYVQKIGNVASLEASGMVAGMVRPPDMINGNQLQSRSIGNRHYQPEENVNTRINSGAPSGGRDGDIVIDSAGKIHVRYGGGWHYASLT